MTLASIVAFALGARVPWWGFVMALCVDGASAVLQKTEVPRMRRGER